MSFLEQKRAITKATQEAVQRRNNEDRSLYKPSYAAVVRKAMTELLQQQQTHSKTQQTTEKATDSNRATETYPPNHNGDETQNEQGWTVVRRKQKRRNPKPKPFNTTLLDHKKRLMAEARCFKCLAKGHNRHQCRNQIKCLHCLTTGHTTRHCIKLSQTNEKAKPNPTSTNTTPPPPNTHTTPPVKPPPPPNTHTTPPVKPSRPIKNLKEMEAIENWETVPMLNPNRVRHLRPDQKRVFVPPRTELPESCQHLERSAIVLVGPHYNDPNLPQCMVTHLAVYFGLRTSDFKVRKVHLAYGNYIITFPTMPLRNHAVHVGVFTLRPGVHIQLKTWTREMAMVPDATSNVARLRLTGTPHQHWHEDDLVILLSEVGHVVRTGPLMDNDSYESFLVLVACHEPVNIPKTLLMTSCPKAAIVQIELEGWLPIPMEPFDPDEADTIRNTVLREPPVR